MQFAHPVGTLREPQTHDRHVKDSRLAALVVFPAEREHVCRIDGRQKVGREVALDERTLESVDTRRHRCVRREKGAGAHDLQRLGEREALGNEIADALEPEESGVPLVGVEHLWLGRAGDVDVALNCAHPADAEQQLLQQSMLTAAAV